MTVERRIASFFGLDDEAWLRHANPLSFWTRLPILPALTLAIWSRAWIGWWAALVVAALLVWTYVNPLFFPEPSSTDNWVSKSVLGERVWTEAPKEEIPSRHHLMPKLQIAASLTGLPFLIWGLYHLQPWPTMLGVTVVLLGKLWFMDRMVWLFEDVKDAPEYDDWLY